MVRLEIGSRARRELTRALEWYDEHRPGLGREFLDCVEAALAVVEENPEAFPQFRRGIRRALVRRFPYALYYIRREDVVRIISVRHTRRSPGVPE